MDSVSVVFIICLRVALTCVPHPLVVLTNACKMSWVFRDICQGFAIVNVSFLKKKKLKMQFKHKLYRKCIASYIINIGELSSLTFASKTSAESANTGLSLVRKCVAVSVWFLLLNSTFGLTVVAQNFSAQFEYSVFYPDVKVLHDWVHANLNLLSTHDKHRFLETG